MAQPSAQDVIDALDRLTKAIVAANAPKEKREPKPKKDTAPEWLQRAERVYDRYQDAAEAAGDLGSGNVGRTLRGVRSAWKMWEKYGGGGGGGSTGGVGGVSTGAEAIEGGTAAEGGAAAGEGAAVAGAGGLAAAAGPAAVVVAVLVGLAVAFKKFKDHVEETTDELIRSQAKLAEVSGAMAAVYAEREMREIQRDINKGDRLAGSARYLAEGEQFRKDKQANIDVLITKVEDRVEGFFNRVLGGIIEPFSDVAGRLEKLVDKITGDTTPETMADWLQRIQDGEQARLEQAQARMQRAAAAIDRTRVRPGG